MACVHMRVLNVAGGGMEKGRLWTESGLHQHSGLMAVAERLKQGVLSVSWDAEPLCVAQLAWKSALGILG